MTGAVKWLDARGIDLIRGNGRLDGVGAVEVDGKRYTADHVVVAAGADPFLPPIPGLAELDGVWGTREATSMKAIPRRLIVLGAGPAGVELAQATRWFGAEVVIVEGADHVLAREPKPLGHALGEVLRRDGIELILGRHATQARRDGDDFVLDLDDGQEVRGERLLVATGRRPRVDGIGLETVGVKPDGHGIPVDSRMQVGERLWAIGDITGIWPLTHVGEYSGEVVASNILGEPREAHFEAVPRVTYTDPQAASVGATEAPFSATAMLSEVAKTATYTHAYAESRRLPHTPQRRRATHRCVRTRARGGGVAAAVDARDPGARPTRRAPRHHPALPELLGDPRRRAEGPSPRDRSRAPDDESVTMNELAGQRVVVIGGSAGIGLETARRARAEGAEVVLTGRDRAWLDDAAADVGAQSTATFDADDPDALTQFFGDAPTPIDHVMVTAGGPHYIPPLEIKPDEARVALSDKLTQTLKVAQESVGRVRPGGSLLFVGGTGGRRPRPGYALIGTVTAALPASDREPRARPRSGAHQPHRAGLRRHTAVGAPPRR